jgi:two-component system chemotaxis sensor kinase CheA
MPSGASRALSAGTETAASPTATVRIPARSLDRFLDTIGELLVQRGRLAGLLKGRSDRALDISLERLKSLVDRLYGDVMGLRMLPFETIAQRFSRSVRELGSAQHKRISLRIAGREVMLDRSMLDELIDPINHLLRNAVDHGIESPAERLAAGKPAVGSIAIFLERAGDSVTIRIEDDGRGMDPEQIRQAAVRKGFLSREAATVDDAAALMLTTIPGFSTTDRVTDVSGRGVGMDVVRTRVERLGGRLVLRSEPGSGLIVEMRLPLTIVVVQAFIVEAGGRNWVVPVSSVRRTFEVAEERVVRTPNHAWVEVGAERIALHDLGGTLKLLPRSEPVAGPLQALIATEHDRSVAFTVDRIVGRREVVVKPLRQPLEELRGFSGATILEDGEIALIVDLLSLARY